MLKFYYQIFREISYKEAIKTDKPDHIPAKNLLEMRKFMEVAL